MSTTIVAREVKKSFSIGRGSKRRVADVLRGVSLRVESGEMVGIVGPSGSGKSTLLYCLSGLEAADSGSIQMMGAQMVHAGRNALSRTRRDHVGFIFQSYNLIPSLSAGENVSLPARLAGRPITKAQTSAVLKSVGLDGRGKSRPGDLSGGEQQRVAIARALATSPKILLCDEATSALDPTTTRSILALLKEINRTLGITIIVITHEMAVIEEICQRVAIIDSSRIAEVGAVDDVFTRPQSAMAKQLIYPDGKRRALATGKRYCRIVFDGNSSFEPVVSNMVLECKAPVNIMFADTKNIDGKAYGQMILQLPEDERAAKRALAYLETQNVHTEEVDANAAV